MDDLHAIEAPQCAHASKLRRRAWPVMVAVAFIVAGMAYSLLWAPVVRHHPYWITPGDLWATYRDAHFVGWGDLGGVYGAGAGLVTFPGVLLALAPVAMITGSFGMTEAFPKAIPHPTAWLVLGPFEMLLSAVALFACDALAERLGMGKGRRRMLCVLEAGVLWNVSVLWGHPEDALSVGLAIYALVFALDGRWTGAGWFFGAALATQPLVLLMFPIMLALVGRHQVIGFVVRVFGPAAALLAAPLVSQFRATTHALLDQPNFPGVDHATPWTAFAPVISGRGHDLTVAAGPGRIVALVLACGLGWWARRWRHEPDLIVWAAASALALRCFTESVMVDFYIWPVFAVALVAAARGGRWRLAIGGVVAVATSFIVQLHLSWLPWWCIVTAGMVLVLACGVRSRSARPLAAVDLSVVTMESDPAVLVGAAS
jgi:hypothetical protein